MRVFYYNLDNAAFVDGTGEQLSRIIPDLYYQEDPDWQFVLRRGDNAVADLSGIVAWGAAVDCDFSTSSVPMCRTLSDGITADTTTGAVTVALDCSTAEFLAAVNGTPARQAWFELYGLDEDGKRILYFCIEIRARMTLDPDPEVSPETPDTVATKAYVSAVMSSGAAAAGALMSGAEIVTSVGGYTVALTSGGGLAVSGSGASVFLSGGQIAASAGENGGSFIVTSGGVVMRGALGDVDEHPYISVGRDSIAGNNGNGVGFNMGGYQFNVNAEDFNYNSRPVAAALVTSTDYNLDDPLEPTANIGVLDGGVNYVYTVPLYQVNVTSVPRTTDASYIHFTLGSTTAVNPVVISGASYLNSAIFEGGKEYLIGFFDGMAVVNEVTQ